MKIMEIYGSDHSKPYGNGGALIGQ